MTDAPKSDDRGLVVRCIAGEEGAWEAFEARYRRVAAFAIRRVLAGEPAPDFDPGPEGEPDPQRVDELVSVVWTHLLEEDYRRLKSFQWDCSLATWLILVASRVARNVLRGERRERQKRERVARDAVFSEVPSPLKHLAQAERIAAVRKGLAALPEKDRRLLLELYREGISQKELAERFSVSTSTLFSRVASAKRRLISFLKGFHSFLLL